MIATLPMYDWPETRAANERLWQRLRENLQEIGYDPPEVLSFGDELLLWQQPDLMLSQTCGYPLTQILPSTVLLVATPTYHTEYSVNGYYASPLLIRKNDTRRHLSEFKGSTFALNDKHSQSGHNSVINFLFDLRHISNDSPGFFRQACFSGSHRSSIMAVATGTADLCAVDPVSWALAKRHEPAALELRVLGNTAYTPALPLISGQGVLGQASSEVLWRQHVIEAFNTAIDEVVRDRLLINGIRFIPREAYSQIPCRAVNLFDSSDAKSALA